MKFEVGQLYESEGGYVYKVKSFDEFGVLLSYTNGVISTSTWRSFYDMKTRFKLAKKSVVKEELDELLS